MGIIATCPNGHRVKVKDELAGRKGICPTCAARFRIPRPGAAPPGPAVATPAASTAGLPSARIVSLDPAVAASLPEAESLADADTAADAGGGEHDVPDFMPAAADELVAEWLTDDEPAAVPDAAVPDPAEPAPASSTRVPAAAAAHAAIDEQPELCWCHAVRGAAPSSPLGAAAMRSWLDSGAGSENHVVWRQDWSEWKPLGEVFPEALAPGRGGRP